MKKTIYQYWALAIFLGLLFLAPVRLFAEETSKPVTGILGAMSEELRILKNEIKGKQTKKLLGIQFVSGELEGREVVVALTGIGKVNAAMTTTLLLENFNPNEVIFTGIAGGINPQLKPGDIIIARKLAQHDFGRVTSAGFLKEGARNPITGKRNPTFIPADPLLISLARKAAQETSFNSIGQLGNQRKPNVIKGVVATGDVFVASKRKKTFLAGEFGADVVEMEGAAVAQICFQQNLPFIVLRSVSDNADEGAQLDLRKFYQTAAENSATLTLSLLRKLSENNSAKQK